MGSQDKNEKIIRTLGTMVLVLLLGAAPPAYSNVQDDLALDYRDWNELTEEQKTIYVLGFMGGAMEQTLCPRFIEGIVQHNNTAYEIQEKVEKVYTSNGDLRDKTVDSIISLIHLKAPSMTREEIATCKVNGMSYLLELLKKNRFEK